MKHLERFIGMMSEDERWHMIRLIRESMHGIGDEEEEKEERPDLSKSTNKRPSKLFMRKYNEDDSQVHQ